MGAERERVYKSWLSEFVALATIGEAPSQFAFWSGVFALSAALGRKVLLPMGTFDWVPNFYIILVAPPGVAVKSTTIGLARQLLEEAGACHFGPSSITWQALTDVMAEAQQETGRAEVALCVSELGTFLDLADAKMVDVLTDLWDGVRREWWHRTRGSRGEPLRDPSLTLIAATTPAWLQAHTSPQVMEGGLASRCIFVLAERKERFVAYPGLKAPPEEWQRRRDALLFGLEAIAELSGEVRLTPEAIAWGEQWYERHWRTSPPRALEGWWARKQAHLHKLAIILSVAEGRRDLVLEPSHLEMAAHILDQTEVSLLNVHRLIEVTDAGRKVAEVERLIREQPGITHEQLYAAVMHRWSAEEVADAIATLVKARRIRLVRREEGVQFEPLD